MWVVDAGETVEAPLVAAVAGSSAVDAWVAPASHLGETDSDISEGDNVATAGEVEVAASVVPVVGEGGGGGEEGTVIEPPGSFTMGAGSDEGSWSWSKIAQGGLGGVVLEVQLSMPVVHMVVLTPTVIAGGATGGDATLAAVTLDEASELSPDDRTTAAAAVGVQDSTTVRGVFPAGVVTVVVVTVAGVAARSGGCGDKAKCWLLASAGASVTLSTEAAAVDDGEETQAEGGSAAVLIAK